ncbi:MAG: F0F1 ATP synthase subunit alpha, partial [Deltaproteobacteria bacterium]|nr:F0F1 ATP synthase subunit alpha [Deltaproteobacteria bacterium]
DLAQYREKQAFAQFGSDLDEATQKQLARGERLVAVLNQPQYVPMKMEEQVMSIFAVTNGYCDNIDPKQIPAFEVGLRNHIETNYSGLGAAIATEKVLTDDITAQLKTAVEEFSKEFSN